MTTVFSTKMFSSHPMDASAKEIVATFATKEERDQFIAAATAAGWRRQSVSDLAVMTVDDATALLSAKTPS